MSASCYWAARGLAEKGHNVFVITNANEIEPRYRISLEKEDLSANGEFARHFPQSGGSVTVYSTAPPHPEAMFYIPQNNPTTSRLATMAADVIQKEKCEVIFASYFEPYCVAAQLAGFWTRTPFVVKHAGSDLYRLFENEDLRTGYLNILLNANRVISGGISTEKLKEIGVDEEKIVENVSFVLPGDFFKPADVKAQINNLIDQNVEIKNKSEFIECFSPIEDDSLPILGIYGKIGEFKGTLDLLQAMAILVKEGFPFYLATMSNAVHYLRFFDAVKNLNLTDYVRCIPFRPHWRVPEFIHSCNAVAFLERDFPIAAHSPTIPTEVLKCGTCLIMSEEIAFKQRSRSKYRNFENAIILPDPKDHKSLAKAIRYALEDENRAYKIGRLGNAELAPSRPFTEYITNMESLLVTVASEKPLFLEKPKNKKHKTVVGHKRSVKKMFPAVRRLLDEKQIELFDDCLAKSVAGNAPLIDEIAAQLASIIENENSSKIDMIKELFRYEVDLFLWNRTWVNAKTAKDGAVASRAFVSSKTLDSLVPSINGNLNISEYSYDVTKIDALFDNPSNYVKEPVKIIFPLSSPPRIINKFTQHLLKTIAENSKTCGEIFESFCASLELPDENSVEKFRNDFLAVMEKLYWLEIIKLTKNEQITEKAQVSSLPVAN